HGCLTAEGHRDAIGVLRSRFTQECARAGDTRPVRHLEVEQTITDGQRDAAAKTDTQVVDELGGVKHDHALAMPVSVSETVGVSEALDTPSSEKCTNPESFGQSSDRVSETTPGGAALTSRSDTSTVSDASTDVLAGMADGAWLDNQKFQPLEYIVPGLVPEGIGLVVAPPKAGKSWFVTDIGLASAAGGKALGRIDVQQRPVLYLALEDGHRRLQSRFRRVMGDGQ